MWSPFHHLDIIMYWSRSRLPPGNTQGIRLVGTLNSTIYKRGILRGFEQVDLKSCWSSFASRVNTIISICCGLVKRSSKSSCFTVCFKVHNVIYKVWVSSLIATRDTPGDFFFFSITHFSNVKCMSCGYVWSSRLTLQWGPGGKECHQLKIENVKPMARRLPRWGSSKFFRSNAYRPFLIFK